MSGRAGWEMERCFGQGELFLSFVPTLGFPLICGLCAVR